MKLLFITVVLLYLNQHVYSQCPQSGIKVQNQDCAIPKGLSIVSATCTEVKIKWTDTRDQSYLIKAALATDNATELKTSVPICNNGGTCTATIEVAPNETVNWSVQTICTQDGITTYSSPVNGPQARIPNCGNVKASGSTTGLQVYPSPSKGSLTVDYSGTIENTLQISIYDVSGKQVFTKSVSATSKNHNQYGLDLHTLTPGSYLLQTTNGSEKKQVKFVLMEK